MNTLKYTLLSLISILAFASCETLDPDCVRGTWRNNMDVGDSIFFYSELVLNDDNTGELNIDSRSCNDSTPGFVKNAVFNWGENEGVLTLTYHDSIVNNCSGLSVHTDSVYTMAYSCTDGLWMSGTVWEKQ